MITACLLCWQRPETLNVILERLSKYEFISEIIIWNNNADLKLTGESSWIRFIHSEQNKIAYGRYLAAKEAKNNLVYVQDDDWLPGDINKLLSFHKPGQVTSFVPETHIEEKSTSRFVGWGSLFEVSALHVFNKYIATYGEDFLLYREADLLFTNVNKYVRHLETARLLVTEDSRSLHHQPNHYKYHDEMIERVRARLLSSTEMN